MAYFKWTFSNFGRHQDVQGGFEIVLE